MNKRFRLNIRKKIFLLTALLSVVLIFVSVTVASAIYTSRLKKDARTLCSNSAKTMQEYFDEYEMQVTASGNTENFIAYYKTKLDDIYQANKEEIEEMSDMYLSSDKDFANKKEYFAGLTSSLFGESTGFGMSYDKLSFKTSYAEISDEMERMASVDGIEGCYVFYYDEASDNLVYMGDSTFSTSWLYRFPGSIYHVTDEIFEALTDRDEPVVMAIDNYFVSYAPIKVDGVVLAYVSFEYSLDYLLTSEREFIGMLVAIMLAAAVGIAIIYLILANFLLVRNVTKLSDAARAFTSHMDEGDVKPVDADIRTGDEIGDLSDDFFALQNKVISYAEDIARKSAEEERMAADLNIASKIQLQSLPDKPLIAEDIRISSFIKPAKEVGGDLFDYFETDQGKVFFAIADVSGKGVPAALFMMRGKEIIRSCAKAGMSADIIAATANRELCKNNGEGLFITAFIGIYDPAEQVLTFARAGHEQPYLLRGGVAEKIGEESNFILGAFDDIPFKAESIRMMPGDRLLLYTDGLNEGINGQNEEFGYERIKAALEETDSDVLATLYERAVAFAEGTEQFDDITMLLLECVRSKSITLASPKYEDIPVVTDKINAFAEGLDRDKIAELDVIIDEVLNNYVSYAFEATKRPQVDIDVRLTKGVIELTFVDNGVLFNPLLAQAPDISQDVVERPAGGVGLMLVKSIADDLHYRVFDGKNRLTVIKDLNA